MSKAPGVIFGFLAIVFLVLIVWFRRDDTAVVMTEPEVTEAAPIDVAAAPAVADPAPAPAVPAVTAAPAPDATPAPVAAEAPPAAEPAPAAIVAAAVEAPRDVARGPGLGVAATAEEIARLNISIPPDGRNLPPGRGTSAEGVLVYIENCVGCHGPRAAGGEGMIALAGGVGTLTTERPVKTVSSFWPYATTLFDYIRRAMPLNAPQSLTDDEVYAVVAFLLSLDDIIPIGTVLDQTTLPLVEMPNRNGFVNWWPEPAAAVRN